MKRLDFIPSTRKAFTLVELLVVIAIITVLVGLFIPAMARTRIKSPAMGCISNLRQLQVGWAIYKDDNNDILLPNAPVGSPANQSWCGGTEDWNFSTANTNESILKASLLAPYIRSNISIFRCPADVIPSHNGPRLRSYSMNSQMGGIFNTPNYNIGWKQYKKGSDLTCPAPADAFIFTDEHPGTIDDGYFQISCNSPSFPSLPSSFHEGACGISFADGHAEMHKWITPALIRPVTLSVVYPPLVVPSANPDWRWVRDHGACQ